MRFWIFLGLKGLSAERVDLSCMIYPQAYEFLDGHFSFSLRYYHLREFLFLLQSVAFAFLPSTADTAIDTTADRLCIISHQNDIWFALLYLPLFLSSTLYLEELMILMFNVEFDLFIKATFSIFSLPLRLSIFGSMLRTRLPRHRS